MLFNRSSHQQELKSVSSYNECKNIIPEQEPSENGLLDAIKDELGPAAHLASVSQVKTKTDRLLEPSIVRKNNYMSINQTNSSIHFDPSNASPDVKTSASSVQGTKFKTSRPTSQLYQRSHQRLTKLIQNPRDKRSSLLNGSAISGSTTNHNFRPQLYKNAEIAGKVSKSRDDDYTRANKGAGSANNGSGA